MLLVANLLALATKPSETVQKSYPFLVGSKRFRIDSIRRSTQNDDSVDGIRVYCDGVCLAAKFGGGDGGAKILSWPFPGKLLAISNHSMCGHGMRTWLFQADEHGLTDLKIELDAEVGGPVYRDVDHDGRSEILFDNYDFYEQGKPIEIRAYKLKNGQLRLWRTLPNPKNLQLPYRLPYF